MPRYPGGLGGPCGSRDTRLVALALKQRWPISDEVRKLLVHRMTQTLAKSESERNRIAAAKVILAVDGLNMQAEQGQSADATNLDELTMSPEEIDADLATASGEQPGGPSDAGGERELVAGETPAAPEPGTA